MDGACTVPKLWDDATRVFYCPGAQPAAPVPEYSPSPQEDARNPQCGHPLLNFIGLGMSGTQDNSELYVQAIQAVDGLCNTCALADDPSGNYFTVMLPAATAVTGVYLVSGEDQAGLFAFVGNATTNNGMDNPVCAQVSEGWGRRGGRGKRGREEGRRWRRRRSGPRPDRLGVCRRFDMISSCDAPASPASPPPRNAGL